MRSASVPVGFLRRLLGRVALSLASLVVTLLVLELAARLLVPSFLVPERDGVHASLLPLVNGRPTDFLPASTGGTPLPTEKGADELRVAAFGESSMEGCPWGHAASPATQLHDALAALLPDVKVTVLNMGRSSSFALDAYYYLVGVAPHHPDVVFFYLGMNERYDLDREACLPVTHPRAYGAWRWLVERSRLAWAARVFLPQLRKAPSVAELRAEVEGAERCTAAQGFQAWTDILVATGRQMGARVVIATPVFSVLSRFDFAFQAESRGQGAAQALRQLRGTHRRLLACLLDDACAFSELALHEEDDRTPGERTLASLSSFFVPGRDADLAESRGSAWKRSAASLGASLIDFAAILRGLTPGNRLGPPHVVDEVHLTVEGYGLLARLVAEDIAAWRAPRSELRRTPPAFPDVARYEAEVDLNTTGLALTYARGRRFLVAAVLSQEPARRGDPRALMLRAWMRRGLGLPAGLPAELEEAFSRFDPESVEP